MIITLKMKAQSVRTKVPMVYFLLQYIQTGNHRVRIATNLLRRRLMRGQPRDRLLFEVG